MALGNIGQTMDFGFDDDFYNDLQGQLESEGGDRDMIAQFIDMKRGGGGQPQAPTRQIGRGVSRLRQPKVMTPEQTEEANMRLEGINSALGRLGGRRATIHRGGGTNLADMVRGGVPEGVAPLGSYGPKGRVSGRIVTPDGRVIQTVQSGLRRFEESPEAKAEYEGLLDERDAIEKGIAESQALSAKLSAIGKGKWPPKTTAVKAGDTVAGYLEGLRSKERVAGIGAKAQVEVEKIKNAATKGKLSEADTKLADAWSKEIEANNKMLAGYRGLPVNPETGERTDPNTGTAISVHTLATLERRNQKLYDNIKGLNQSIPKSGGARPTGGGVARAEIGRGIKKLTGGRPRGTKRTPEQAMKIIDGMSDGAKKTKALELFRREYSNAPKIPTGAGGGFEEGNLTLNEIANVFMQKGISTERARQVVNDMTKEANQGKLIDVKSMKKLFEKAKIAYLWTDAEIANLVSKIGDIPVPLTGGLR